MHDKGLLRGVHGPHIPFGAAAAGNDGIGTGLAVNVAGLVPYGGHPAQEVQGRCRRIFQIVGGEGKVLYRVLEYDGGGKGEGVGCAAHVAPYPALGIGPAVRRVHIPVEEGAAVLHTAHRVAAEGMEGGAQGLDVAVVLVEDEVLRGPHGLRSNVIGVHPLPAARQGAAVENHHQAVVGGIGQYVLVVAEGLLLVAGEEVHLYALDPYAAEPLHLLLAGDGLAHNVDGALLDVVPPAGAGIPEEYINPLGMSVFHKVLHSLPAYVHVPPVVDENKAEAHLAGKVYVPDLVVVIDAAVLPEYPAPGALAVGPRPVALVEGFHEVEGHGGLGYRGEGGADGHGAPGGGAGKGEGGLHGAIAAILLRHREFYLVAAVGPVAQAAAAVMAVIARLAHQRPAGASYPEKAGEGVSVPEFRRLGERPVPAVELLVAGFCALPAHHGVALRADEACGALGEGEAAFLAQHPHAAPLPFPGKEIAEGYVGIAHAELYAKGLTVGILEAGLHPPGLVLHMGGLGPAHLIFLTDQVLLRALEDKVGVGRFVGGEAEGRGGEHLHAVEAYGIGHGARGSGAQMELETAVGAAKNAQSGQEGQKYSVHITKIHKIIVNLPSLKS